MLDGQVTDSSGHAFQKARSMDPDFVWSECLAVFHDGLPCADIGWSVCDRWKGAGPTSMSRGQRERRARVMCDSSGRFPRLPVTVTICGLLGRQGLMTRRHPVSGTKR